MPTAFFYTAKHIKKGDELLIPYDDDASREVCDLCEGEALSPELLQLEYS